MNKTRTRILASLLCMALIFGDVVPTGLVAQAAEVSQQVSAETELGGDNELTFGETPSEDTSDDAPEEQDPSEKETDTEDGETGEEAETPEEEESTPSEEIPSEDPDGDEAEEQDSSEEETDTEDGETGEEAETPEEEIPEEETDAPEIGAPEDDEVEEIEEPKTVAALTAGGDEDEGEIIDSGTYTKNGSDTQWVLYSDGKLVVTGTGEVRETINFSDGTVGSLAVPWYDNRDKIITAEISVKGMKNAHALFNGCSNLESIDVSQFDTSQITDMGSMFSNCSNLTDLDVSGFDTGKVTDMSYMFQGCRSLPELNVSNFVTDKVVTMKGMFSGCHSLLKLDVSGFNTSNVTDMASMFGCESLTELNVSSFDTHNVTDMSHMFSDCESLTELNVSGFNTGQVTDMNYMFWVCKNLTKLDVSGFDTRNVTDMSLMFYWCKSVTKLDVSGFDTGKVTKMNSMFNGCENLTELDVSGFDTENVLDMNRMFCECKSLTQLDVSSFDTSNVTNMELMLAYCESLKELDLSGFDTGNVTNANRMFDTSNKLEVICAPLNLKKSVALPKANNQDVWYRADNRNKLTELPKGLSKSILLTKNKKIDAQGYIVARKGKTDYLCNETVNTDDITVIHYNSKGESTKLTEGFTIYVEEIDMSCPGIKDLVITYVDPNTETNPEKTELTATVKLTVTYGLSVEDVEITLRDDKLVYNGYPQRPKPVVSVRTSGSDNTDQASERKILIEGTDYRVSYDNGGHIDAGEKVEVIITGIGDYSQTVIETFVINKAKLTIQAGDITLAVGADLPKPELFPYKAIGLAADDRLEVTGYTFTKQDDGSEVDSQDITSEQGIYSVKLQADAGNNYEVNSQEGILTVAEEGVAYTVTFEMMGHGGDNVRIIGIKAGSLIDEQKVPEEEGYVFTGWYKDKTFAAKQKWNFDTDTVQADTILYACWLEKGIKAEDGGELQFFIQDIQHQYYTGSAIKPTVYVYAADGATLLKSGKDYTIKYAQNIQAVKIDSESGEPTESGGTAIFTDSGKIGKEEPDKKIAGNFNAALPYVIITGKGNYSGIICKNFQILPAGISTDDGSVAAGFTLKYSDQLVTNTKKDQKPFTSLKYKKAMTAGKDYTVTLSAEDAYEEGGKQVRAWSAAGDDTNKYIPAIPKGYYGTFKMIVTGQGNYSGIFTKEVKVTDKKHLMKNASVTLGKNQKSRTLEENQLTPGYCATVTISGKKKTLYYSVDRSGTQTEADAKDIFLVKSGGEYLIYGVDYKVSYTNNNAVGTATMTITGMGEYMGSKSVTFKITGTAFNTKNVVVKLYDAQKPDEKDAFKTSMAYTGKAITQNKVLLTNGKEKTEEGYKAFAYGTDYTISYKNNIKKGTATMTFTARPESGYSGSFKRTFKIEAQSLLDVEFGEENIVEVKQTDKDKNTKTMAWNGETPSYSKNGATLAFTLKNAEGMELRQGTDYTVSYKNNKVATVGNDNITANNQPTLTIKGKGNYAGTLTVTFPINKADIATLLDNGSLTISASSVAKKDGMKFKDFKVKILDGKKTLGVGDGKDYLLTECTDDAIQDYAEALEQKKATPELEPKVTIKGIGDNYTGEKTVSLAKYIYVTKLTSKNISIEVTGDTTYTGSNGKVEPTVKVTYYPNGKTGDGSVMLTDEDYELSYGANNVAGKNKGSVTVTGKGIYGGSVTQKFSIQSKDVYK